MISGWIEVCDECLLILALKDSHHFVVPSVQGVSGALTVLMRDAIKPNLMQTLEVGGGLRASEPQSRGG